MQEIERIEKNRKIPEDCLTKLIKKIGKIQIGTKDQFPFGWRKAGKGRTVWRILEEVVSQNLEKHHKELGIQSVTPSDSEVSVFDFVIRFDNCLDMYVNIKSAVTGGRTNKDDISKALGLIQFYEENKNRDLFIATIQITFSPEMFILLEKCYVMPIAWLPDVYVNPSNNGNLQSSKYKDVAEAKKRSNEEFIIALKAASEVAIEKRKKVKALLESVEESGSQDDVGSKALNK
ncbi:MAG TPA: hypothetical protein VG347_05495 [Verrucomicrobiae bacterium]|nr:hypothetical protein [Verrucomicrobiae bacterium]